ncbi:ribonuclease HI family protein [Leuconostoc mesenteroides]|uniref:ribonuclease HI family protein n=1 Tax=Leuconostoc mesenteroides TaxID=1245 RepID=UPI00388702D3
MITLYVDAARDVSTGRSSAGAVLIIDKVQKQLKTALRETVNNHEAEFLAVLWALKYLPSNENVQIYSDSKIVTDAWHKSYAKHYQGLVDEINLQLTPYPLVLINWVPEKENRGAHNLALQALKNANH